MFPTMASAVVPIYNLNAHGSLLLSLTVLARIFRGNITTWDDPAIQALNPSLPTWGVPPQQPISLVVRADGSGTTMIFKKSLGKIDPLFADQIGTTLSPEWPNVTVTARDGNQGVLSYVMLTPYSLGYCVLGDAVSNGVPFAAIQNAGGKVVVANATSIDFAVLQLGMSFGNNGDNPSRLTVNLEDADGPFAWPLVGFTYIIIRKSILRPAATCAQVGATVAFWYWFYNSNIVASMMTRLIFSPLPSTLKNFIVSRLVSEITCNSQEAWVNPADTPIAGSGPAVTEDLFVLLGYMYSHTDSTYPVVFTATTPDPTTVTNDSLVTSTFVVSYAPPASPLPNGATLLLAAIGIVAVGCLNLVLDIPTLAAILEGNITTWMDPAIQALNPQGITNAKGVVLSDPNRRIVLLRGPMASGTLTGGLLREFVPSYSGKALLSAQSFASEGALLSAVVGNAYTLSVTALTDDFPDGAQLIPLCRTESSAVLPTWNSVQACATADVYDAVGNTFHLAASASPSCYPLSVPLHISILKSQCDYQSDPSRTATSYFLDWLVGSGANTFPAFYASRLAPLLTISPDVAARNEAAINLVTCQPPASQTALYIGVAAAVVGAVFAVVLCGMWWQYRSRKDNSAAPKDSNRPYTVLFTDIQSSTNLWAVLPGEMAAVLDFHHSLIRGLIRRHRLYEVKTIGDSFMCACHEPRNAIDFALELQRELYAHDWGPAGKTIDLIYEDDVAGATPATPMVDGADGKAWNGLRVRIGIHHGIGSIRFDSVARGYDYYGTVVNTAARIESICHGGQIGITHEVLQKLGGVHPNCVWSDLGLHALRGLAEPVRVFQVLPDGPLASRTFPSLRIEKVGGWFEADGHRLERQDTGFTLGTVFTTFQPERHALVMKGEVGSAELKQIYAIATATLQTVLATQTVKACESMLSRLCHRLKVEYQGTPAASPLALHGIVMRILPALVSAPGRRSSGCLPQSPQGCCTPSSIDALGRFASGVPSSPTFKSSIGLVSPDRHLMGNSPNVLLQVLDAED